MVNKLCEFYSLKQVAYAKYYHIDGSFLKIGLCCSHGSSNMHICARWSYCLYHCMCGQLDYYRRAIGNLSHAIMVDLRCEFEMNGFGWLCYFPRRS